MPTNEILPFAIDGGANVVNQEDYDESAYRLDGFSSGVANSAQLNKVWRQSSFMAAGIAGWLASRGEDVLDDGDLPALIAKFTSVFNSLVPSGVPTGTVLEYSGTTAPSGYLLCYGQAISRTEYSDLFDAIGTTHGAGDGSTTFNIPDRRGRAAFGKDDMGGSAANRITNAISGIDGDTLGATGGDQRMQQHDHTASFTADPHSHTLSGSAGGADNGGVDNAVDTSESVGTSSVTVTGSVTVNDAGAGSSQNMPPAIIQNFIIKT